MNAVPRKQTLLFMLLLGLLLALTISPTTAIGQEDNDDEDDTREVTIEISEQEATIKSEKETDTGKDEFEATIDVNSDPEIKFDYKVEGGDNTVNEELKVVLNEIIEFIDEDSGGTYDENDTVVQVYELSDIGFDDLAYVTNDLGDDGTEHVITATTNDEVFSFVTHVTECFTQINGTNVKPTQLKIDYMINDFPYQETDSKLALFNMVESSSRELNTADISPDEADGTASEPEESITDGIATYFAWSTVATIDGTETDVLSSYGESTATEEKLYLNYEHGNEIIHDPKLGIDTSDGNEETTGTTDESSRLWPDVSKAALVASSIFATLLFLAVPVALYWITRRK